MTTTAQEQATLPGITLEEIEADMAKYYDSPPVEIVTAAMAAAPMPRPGAPPRLVGTASSCAICHKALTDAVSIERAIGPDCSGHGYDVPDRVTRAGDVDRARAALAGYPEIVAALPTHVREAVNYLVRVAALNEHRERLVLTIATAVSIYGFLRLAALLRERFAVVEIWKLETGRHVRVTRRGRHHVSGRKLFEAITRQVSVARVERVAVRVSLVVPASDNGGPIDLGLWRSIAEVVGDELVRERPDRGAFPAVETFMRMAGVDA